MARKSDIEKIRQELAEVQAEKANVAARMAELDRRLNDDSSTLAELRQAGDELADARRYMQALDQRLVGLTSKRLEAEAEEQKARIAALHEEEGAVYAGFCQAIEQFAAGPMQELLDVQGAIRDAGGVPKYSHRAREVAKAVGKFERFEAMLAHQEARKAELRA